MEFFSFFKQAKPNTVTFTLSPVNFSALLNLPSLFFSEKQRERKTKYPINFLFRFRNWTGGIYATVDLVEKKLTQFWMNL